jgi:outer membrane murein-binding lipoprotein Lpp
VDVLDELAPSLFVLALESDLDALESDLDALESDLDALESDLDALESDLDALLVDSLLPVSVELPFFLGVP